MNGWDRIYKKMVAEGWIIQKRRKYKEKMKLEWNWGHCCAASKDKDEDIVWSSKYKFCPYCGVAG